MRTFWIVAFVMLNAICYSQTYYWVKFTDKNNSPFSVQMPQNYLSASAIERRTKEGIAIDSTDLPVNAAYVNAILPYVEEVKHVLKWFNTAVVKLNGTQSIDSVLQFSFVESADTIYKNPYKKMMLSSKVEEVKPVNQQFVYPNRYGLAYRQANMLNVDLLHQLGYKGQGITMALMDNGYSSLDNIKAFDSVRSRILFTYDFVHNEQNVYDDGAHGTNTFSCIAANWPGQFVGTATEANYFLLESEDNDNEWQMEEYNWAAAAEWADSAGAQLFSTSLGYTTFDDGLGDHTYADLDGNTTIITRAGNFAASKGIIVCNSAGNEGNKSWYHISAAADGDKIIAVGAVDSAEVIADFSGRGPAYSGAIKPNVVAHGKGNYCITVNGDVGKTNGTSFSCPIFAGSVAALWSAFPNKSSKEITDAIMISCDKFWDPDNNYGYGIPDFYTAYLLLKTNYNDKILRTDNDVVVYPNPFIDEVNIAAYGQGTGFNTFEIYDLQGRKIVEEKIFIRDKTFEIVTLTQTVNLPAGEYLLRWNKSKTTSHRIVKLK
ncbi:MAG: S8 family peptidase [Chitinophagales bacterium]|nr:S8 family peptidase [Chitinophagales bacterium]